ncbi:MAG: DUF2807 domain-containing protein [Bacteroidetes bacterium]|nr:DUF2807 domain-containing protein [Bacteroidota bacterium]
MKSILISSLFLIGSLTIKAQISQNREAQPFKKIELSGAANVVYTQSDTLSLKVVADDNEINNIYTSFENETLIIRAKGNFSHPYKVYVSSNSLNQITASGASKFASSNTITPDSLSIDVTGASEVTTAVKAKAVDAMISGASSVSLSGNAQNLYATVSGASGLKAYKLTATNANVRASGASSVKVFANEKINANATGSSTIKFKGDPKDVSAEASSSSSIAKVVDDETSKKSGDKKDSTTINFRNKQYVIINKDKNSDTTTTYRKKHSDDFHHWGGFGMGVNGWLSNGNFGLPASQSYMDLNYGKSLNFQLNPWEKDIHIYKNHVNLVIGVGFEWSQYQFNNKTKLNSDSSYTYGTIDSTNTLTYKKNRLKTTFVNVPVLFEFNTNKDPKKAFHIAIGAIGGYKLGSRTRQVVEFQGNTIRYIKKDDYNINPFRVNAHASIGYHNFTLYADYALNPLFENGKGPELYPFTIGVKLISF